MIYQRPQVLWKFADLAVLAAGGHHGGVGAERNAGHVVEMALLLKDIGLWLPFPYK